jgi:hypothetical protein
MARLVGRKCNTCEFDYDVLVWPDGTGIVCESDVEGETEELPCPWCDTTGYTFRIPVPAKPPNRVKGIDCRKTVGRVFEDAKALDKWAAENGCTPVSSSSSTWRSFKDEVKEKNAKDAQSRGFSTLREEAKHRKANLRESVAAAREKQIETYHKAHGSDGKLTVEKAFGELPDKA